ncbi:MAG TPA: hypothetical protein VH188_05965 [Chthoniobacterales bacterium]|jgi:hypothetical protein|nr:hypothetical protein [Chthoniobacterales bacterium]
MAKKLIIGGLLGLVLITVKICFFSTMKASVALSEGSFCEIRTNGLYHWVTDRRIPLLYRKKGQDVGRLEFTYSPEWYPEAIFPTEDRQNLICFYGTDLTLALFVIELNKNAAPDHAAPKGLFTSSPAIIRYTDFALRRCTSDEVTYVKRYIQASDDAALRKMSLTGLPFPYDPVRNKQYLLTKIEHVTTPLRVPLAGEIPEVTP